jgi:hypothetical protein
LFSAADKISQDFSAHGAEEGSISTLGSSSSAEDVLFAQSDASDLPGNRLVEETPSK